MSNDQLIRLAELVGVMYSEKRINSAHFVGNPRLGIASVEIRFPPVVMDQMPQPVQPEEPTTPFPVKPRRKMNLSDAERERRRQHGRWLAERRRAESAN